MALLKVRFATLTALPALADGNSWAHAQGFLFHWDARPGGPGPSYSPSAGIGTVSGTCRQPGGQDVLRGVDIPIMPGAAGGARPVARPEAEDGEQVAACRARLGCGIPAVHDGDRTAAAPGLVLQHGPELRPAGAGNRTREAAVAEHPGHVQVLDCDHVEPAHDAGARLVQEVPPGVGHPGMRPGGLKSGFLPVRRSPLTAGQLTLVPLEPALVPLPVPRV